MDIDVVIPAKIMMWKNLYHQNFPGTSWENAHCQRPVMQMDIGRSHEMQRYLHWQHMQHESAFYGDVQRQNVNFNNVQMPESGVQTGEILPEDVEYMQRRLLEIFDDPSASSSPESLSTESSETLSIGNIFIIIIYWEKYVF